MVSTVLPSVYFYNNVRRSNTRNFGTPKCGRSVEKEEFCGGTVNIFPYYDIVFFIEGSKMVYGISARVFSDTHSLTKLYGIPGYGSECGIVILVNNQTTIKTLHSVAISSMSGGSAEMQ